jgi:hypothetical protein
MVRPTPSLDTLTWHIHLQIRVILTLALQIHSTTQPSRVSLVATPSRTGTQKSTIVTRYCDIFSHVLPLILIHV